MCCVLVPLPCGYLVLQKGGLMYLAQEKPDVLCIQETKCSEAKLPKELKVDGYKAHWVSAEKEGYAGTGMYTKTDPISVKYGIGKSSLPSPVCRILGLFFSSLLLVIMFIVIICIVPVIKSWTVLQKITWRGGGWGDTIHSMYFLSLFACYFSFHFLFLCWFCFVFMLL